VPSGQTWETGVCVVAIGRGMMPRHAHRPS
jgi:hypothetical protein